MDAAVGPSNNVSPKRTVLALSHQRRSVEVRRGGRSNLLILDQPGPRTPPALTKPPSAAPGRKNVGVQTSLSAELGAASLRSVGVNTEISTDPCFL